MNSAHRRHDISDKEWEVLAPHLIGSKGTWGGNARDNRLFINAVFWILRTGAPWRALPPDYGDWKNTHRRFCRWRDKGIWARILEAVIDEPAFEWLMIDAGHIKVHPHTAGARGGNAGHGPYKRRLNSKIHLAMDAHGMPVRTPATAGTTADCTQADEFVDGMDAGALTADKVYDADAVIEQALHARMEIVIPSFESARVPSRSKKI